MTMTLVALLFTVGVATQAEPDTGPTFHAPVRLEAEGKLIRVDAPGYAAPCRADIDGDGDADLLVGQFAGGRIHVFENKGDGSYAEGRFLMADGKIAKVPGVW